MIRGTRRPGGAGRSTGRIKGGGGGRKGGGGKGSDSQAAGCMVLVAVGCGLAIGSGLAIEALLFIAR